VAELRGEAQRGAPTRRSGLLGAICRVREGLSLDAAVRVGRAGRALETEVRAGLTWAFPAP